MDRTKNERASRALGIGLCDSRNILSAEQGRQLEHDLVALHTGRTGVRGVAYEVIQ